MIIDIENTIVTKIQIKSKQEFDQIRGQENFLRDYIVLKKFVKK